MRENIFQHSFIVQGKDHEYLVRPALESDGNNLNCVYNSFTGRSRSFAQYQWQWHESPFGKSDSWLILNSKNEVVGHHGVMPVAFNLHGKEIQVGKTENTFVLKECAREIYYPGVEKNILQRIENRYDFIFTTASGVGRGAIKLIRQRLGYKNVGASVVYALRFSPDTMRKLVELKFRYKTLAVLAGIFHPILYYLYMYFTGWRVKKGTVLPVDWAVLHEVEEFWHQNAKYYGLTPSRTRQYLRWRYVDNPHADFQLLRIESQGNVIGYAVVRKYLLKIAGISLVCTMIDDVFVQGNSPENFEVALFSLNRFFKNEAMLLLVTLKQKDSIDAGIRSLLGWFAGLHSYAGPDFLVRAQTGEVPSVFFTNIFSEGTSYDTEHTI